MRGHPLRSGVKALQVRHAMTKDVISVSAQATVLEAARLMRRYHISGLPVVAGGTQVVGVLSEKDVAQALDLVSPGGLLDLVLDPTGLTEVRLTKMRERLGTVTVGEVMSSEAAVISPDAPIEAAAQMMRERKINRLPVVEGERLVGILTRHDVLHAL